jgi:hypothetical protein
MMGMDDDAALPQHLVKLLDWRDAHAGFEDGVKDWPVKLRGVKPPGAAHTAWQLFEHMRKFAPLAGRLGLKESWLWKSEKCSRPEFDRLAVFSSCGEGLH